MELQGKRAAVLVEQMYQELEVWYPIYRLREAGCKVTLVGPEVGQTYPSKLGYPVKSDKAAREVSAEDFRDANIITRRTPDDLPAFMQTVIQVVREAKPALAGAKR